LTHHSEAKVAVVEDLSFLERFLKVRGELPQLERVVVLNDPDGLAPDDVLTRDDLFGGDAADLDELVDVARPEDLATIIYTSGTTGPPKGVMIDHRNVAWTGESLLRTIGQPTEGWRQISYLPMAHIAERMTGDYKVAITGAAPISTEVLWFFRAIGVPLSEIYGMSESTGPMTWDPYEVKIGTVGRAIVGCDVRRADDGEVIFRGGNAFKGYLKEPEKTAETLDDEGWVHSGDIGQFDDDGYLSIVDRK